MYGGREVWDQINGDWAIIIDEHLASTVRTARTQALLSPPFFHP